MIEITTFRLRADVEEAEFLAADADAQAGFFYQQPGLVRRTTARPAPDDADAGDRWLVLTSWGDAAAAQAAAAALADPSANAAARRYLDCLDDVEVRRFEPLPG